MSRYPDDIKHAFLEAYERLEEALENVSKARCCFHECIQAVALVLVKHDFQHLCDGIEQGLEQLERFLEDAEEDSFTFLRENQISCDLREEHLGEWQKFIEPIYALAHKQSNNPTTKEEPCNV